MAARELPVAQLEPHLHESGGSGASPSGLDLRLRTSPLKLAAHTTCKSCSRARKLRLSHVLLDAVHVMRMLLLARPFLHNLTNFKCTHGSFAGSVHSLSGVIAAHLNSIPLICDAVTRMHRVLHQLQRWRPHMQSHISATPSREVHRWVWS